MLCPQPRGGGNETARLHQSNCRFSSGSFAARGTRAAAGDACDRVLERPLPRRYWAGMQAFLKGLGEAGFFDGQNVIIEYRWARGEYGRLPAFAAELVQRRVNVLVATGGEASAVAAKQATATIPIA